MVKTIRQVGVIPFRRNPLGLRVLLITSRDTGRWVIPKGNIDKGFTSIQAAEREAYEEAGIKGFMYPVPLGFFSYNKRLQSNVLRAATVEVYALLVEKQLKKWPERKQRKLKWVTPKKAAKLVEESGMKRLLLRLQEMHSVKATYHKLQPEH